MSAPVRVELDVKSKDDAATNPSVMFHPCTVALFGKSPLV
jgi:hypothetical protein